MTSLELQSRAVKSARSYYDYLSETGKGVAAFTVQSILRKDCYFYLHLGSKLPRSYDFSDLMFDFSGKRHTSFQIRPISYSYEESVLTVRPLDAMTGEFANLKAGDLTVISDLRFLVKRVEFWYQQYGASISMNSSAPSVTPVFLAREKTLSAEQRAAISGALSHPFSYIWGAPGTGKTSCVLANCVLSYLMSGKKVLLVAPTNNALEQMLSGVLPALSEQHISFNTVLRLGSSSARFSSLYPEVCEFLQAERLLVALKEKRAFLKKGLAFLRFSVQFDRVLSESPSKLSEIQRLRDAYRENKRILQKLNRDSASMRARLTLLQDETNRLLESVSKRKHTVEHSLLFRLKKAFLPSASHQYIALLEQEQTYLSEKIEKIESIRAELSGIINLQTGCTDEQSQISRQMREKVDGIIDLCSFWTGLKDAVSQCDFSSSESVEAAFLSVIQPYKDQLALKGHTYQSFSGRSPSSLEAELLDCETKITELEANSTASRLKDVKVVGATVDRFLASFSPDGCGDFHPAHIFMDEAGYMSLVKAMPLFSLQVPVTLIGDHMQLPPVCEMGDSQFRSEDSKEVFLFAQSALYAESIFTDQFDKVLSDYLQSSPPACHFMRKYDLTATFRFGDTLASLLASFIYSSEFHSESDSGTAIYYLDAPEGSRSQKRTSQAEVSAIQRFLSHSRISDFAILTPYRNQAALLASSLPKERKDGRIMTVHASQGREWDVLFFSVVDTNDKWFTDSNRSETRGKMIVNTAVSRARKALVLVCDAEYWSKHPQQLIGRLVLSASPLSNDEGGFL